MASNRILTAPQFVDELPPANSDGSRITNLERIEMMMPAMIAQPGRWAAVAEYHSVNGAGELKRRLIDEGLGDKGWEFANRIAGGTGTGNPRSVLYMRYTGPDDPQVLSDGAGTDGPTPSDASGTEGPEVEGPARGVPDLGGSGSPMFATCTCRHTQRRHHENEGVCQAASCDCDEFTEAS